MLKWYPRIFVTVIALIIFCVPLLPDRDRPADYSGSGMKKISAAGMSFSQGWNNPQASYDERPGMESRFTYVMKISSAYRGLEN
jgi:hypothetical protein